MCNCRRRTCGAELVLALLGHRMSRGFHFSSDPSSSLGHCSQLISTAPLVSFFSVSSFLAMQIAMMRMQMPSWKK